MKLTSIKKPSIIGAIAIIFAASMWGLDGVVLRPHLYHLFDYVPVVVFCEHLIAFIFMMVFFAAAFMYGSKNTSEDIKGFKSLGIKDWSSFFWIALFGGAIGTMAITKALFHVNFEHLSAIVILQKLQPLFVILLSIIILKERPKIQFYYWAAVALVGSYFITFGFNAPVLAENKLFVASLFSLLAAFSFGSSTVFGKRVVSKISFRLATYIRFGLTSVLLIAIIAAITAISEKSMFAGFFEIGIKEIIIMTIIALTSGGTAIFIYYYGLKRIMASKASIYELGFPVTAVVLDYIVNNNIMGPGQWIGAVLIVGSMYMVTKLKQRGAES